MVACIFQQKSGFARKIYIRAKMLTHLQLL